MIDYKPIIQSLQIKDLHTIDVLRLDSIHPDINGNKWFKLKNNLQRAREENRSTIITFGGAFSNHIAATASACKLANIESVGIIRGEKPLHLNYTLKKAQAEGMHLHFVSREDYRKKEDESFKKFLVKIFGKHHLIPEGGNNSEGVTGCMDILKSDWNYEYIICACGTSATYLGLLCSAKPQQKIIGINVLKGKNDLVKQAQSMANKLFPEKKIQINGNDALNEVIIKNSFITDQYSFSGYAKYDKLLVEFKHEFVKQYGIPLDYVYTTKLFYGIINLMMKKKIPADSKVLVIHSGGLQGNKGFEERHHLAPML